MEKKFYTYKDMASCMAFTHKFTYKFTQCVIYTVPNLAVEAFYTILKKLPTPQVTLYSCWYVHSS